MSGRRQRYQVSFGAECRRDCLRARSIAYLLSPFVHESKNNTVDRTVAHDRPIDVGG